MATNILLIPPTPVSAAAPAVSTPVVFVIDDDASVRESLETLISAKGWRTETFSSGREFLSRPHAKAPSCLVLDASLPGVSGLDIQACLAGRLDMPIVFMTENARLLSAITEAINQSGAAICRDADAQVLRRRYASLTPRERDVMALVTSGLLNKQAGGELGISETTVKAHRGRVMRKMQADSLPELVTMAARLGVSSRRTADGQIASRVWHTRRQLIGNTRSSDSSGLAADFTTPSSARFGSVS
jgi:FixJ family two-component response regulator